MKIIINPGAGPVQQATEENAIINMEHFKTDCGGGDINFIRTPKADYGDGRFAFLLWKGTRCHTIQMPGLELSKVRYTDEENQNIWDYPRLYVDGSSWVWKFAVLNSEDDWAMPED